MKGSSNQKNAQAETKGVEPVAAAGKGGARITGKTIVFGALGSISFSRNSHRHPTDTELGREVPISFEKECQCDICLAGRARAEESKRLDARGIADQILFWAFIADEVLGAITNGANAAEAIAIARRRIQNIQVLAGDLL